MKNVLVTGATGFLGQNLVQTLLKDGYSVVGTGHSEYSIKNFESQNTNIPLYALDVSDSYGILKTIIKKHNITHIVHCAALKHIGICESNPTRTVNINVLGSKNIIDAAIDTGVKNIIGISTDKAINPSCIYGMSKKMMEEMLIEHNFGVFQGVNFLFSTGSVLDIWEKMMSEGREIRVNTRARRYFCLIDDVCQKISNNLDNKGIFSVNDCYKVSILGLQKAFSMKHNYWNISEYTPLNIEKDDEELPLSNIVVKEPSNDEIIELLNHHYARMKR